MPANVNKLQHFEAGFHVELGASECFDNSNPPVW